MSGIYIHIPFCKTFCNYCDFHSETAGPSRTAVLRAMLDELEQRRGYLSNERITTIYIGGGTPSVCDPDELGAFLNRIGELWDTSCLKEVTLEANPNDLTEEYAKKLLGAGFNRISIGVQSFIDEHLQWMNRRHSASEAVNAMNKARRAGFTDISLDLIYGMGQLSDDQWRYDLTTAVQMRPEHISAYSLTVEPGTVFGKRAAKGEQIEATAERCADQFRTMREVLCGAGYEHYEVSNFALPGHMALHNSNYWNGTQYLGIGPGAHSYNGVQRSWNVADNGRYMALQPSGGHCETEILGPNDLFNEYMMTSLRCNSGIDTGVIEARFGTEKLRHFENTAQKFISRGIMLQDGKNIKIPPEHYFISDGIISEFFSV